MSPSEVLYSSKKMDWETPDDLFATLDGEFQFTVDAAADVDNAKCDLYWHKYIDGLQQDWTGHTVWCNPPYGREVSQWVAKARHESEFNGATVVMLIPSRTDTRWFHEYIYNHAEIRFLRGRVKFLNNGIAGNSAPFPSMIVIFR